MLTILGRELRPHCKLRTLTVNHVNMTTLLSYLNCKVLTPVVHKMALRDPRGSTKKS